MWDRSLLHCIQHNFKLYWHDYLIICGCRQQLFNYSSTCFADELSSRLSTQFLGSTYLHCLWWINYVNSFQSDSRDISFVVVNNENIIQAFCPCGIYNSPEDSKETSLSFSGSPFSVPIFSSTLNPSTLRKVMDKCFEHYDYIANKHNATTIKFISNPRIYYSKITTIDITTIHS